MARVADRVRHGGHAVPDETVKRRYTRGLVNFFRLHRPLADTWTLCDNSGDRLVKVAHGMASGKTRIFDAEKLSTIERSARDAECAS